MKISKILKPVHSNKVQPKLFERSYHQRKKSMNLTFYLRLFSLKISVYVFAVFLSLSVDCIVCMNIDQIPMSSVVCAKSKNYFEEDRRCIYKNLIYYDGTFYFIGNLTKNILIRTAVSHLDNKKYPLWSPNIKMNINEIQVHLPRVNVTPAPFETAILWRRLLPSNYYHHLFEDYHLILRARKNAGGFDYNDITDHQIIFLDSGSDTFKNTYSYSFIRQPKRIQEVTNSFVKGTYLIIKNVIVGTESTCGHRFHCLHQMGADSLLKFRAMLHSRLKLCFTNLPYLQSVTLRNVTNTTTCLGPFTTAPNIGIIQRLKSRRFVNLPAANIIQDTIGLNTTIYHTENSSMLQQAKVFSQFDIVVMMHGGAIGNWLFMKTNSVVVDILPAYYDHPLTDWIAEDLQTLNITYLSCFLSSTDARPNFSRIK